MLIICLVRASLLSLGFLCSQQWSAGMKEGRGKGGEESFVFLLILYFIALYCIYFFMISPLFRIQW